MAAPKLVWTELHDQALLKLTGLPVFSADSIQASLPQDGARIRLVVGDTCYLDGELFEPADPEGSIDLNGVLTRTGEWVGLTWSVRKRTPCKWPYPRLLRSGTALNSALLPTTSTQTPALVLSREDVQEDTGVSIGETMVKTPQREMLTSLDSQMGSLATLLADDSRPHLSAACRMPRGSDDSANSEGAVNDKPSAHGASSECSDLLQGLREQDMERRLEAMGSIAGILEILPHIDMQCGGATSLTIGMVHDGTVEALVGIIRGDSGGAVLEVTSACQVLTALALIEEDVAAKAEESDLARALDDIAHAVKVAQPEVAAQLLSAVCGWGLCMALRNESVVEDDAVCQWDLNTRNLKTLLTESVPASQEALSLLEVQLWNHLDSPTGEGLVALRQAGAATALSVLTTTMQLRQHDGLRTGEGAGTKSGRQAMASMRRDTAQRVWQLLATRTAQESNTEGIFSPAPLGSELLTLALWRLLAVAVNIDGALQSWCRSGGEKESGNECSWVIEILQAAQRQLCPIEDRNDSKGGHINDRDSFLRPLHRRAAMDTLSQLLANSESSAVATQFFASALPDGKASGTPGALLPIQAALQQIVSGDLNERNAERASATKLLSQWNRLVRSRDLSNSASRVSCSADTGSTPASVGYTYTATVDQAAVGTAAGAASTSMLPGVAMLRQTAAVIIELGALDILAQPHVDVLCDGIADLVAHSVTDWRVAGLAVKAVELVAVFSEDIHGNARDRLPANLSLGCKRQLGRQLVRLAGPEKLK